MSGVGKITGHEACFVCQEKFCFSNINDCDAGVETEMVFGLEHEGWRGIPHGGVAMTALLDLADHCWLRQKGMNLVYPLTIEWRFADAVTIGDKMHLQAVVKGDNLLYLLMQRQGSEKIYLRAEVQVGSESAEVGFKLPQPSELLQSGVKHKPLEVYDNCFVCGRKRQRPGLQCRFFKTIINPENPAGQDLSAVIVRFGESDSGASFQQASNRLHPGVLAALLDELCGWSGVLADDLYGYTVRFKLNINRLPEIGDEFFGFSPTPGVRGRGARKFYHPAGALYRQLDDGVIEIFASASGQWLARDELRQQFDESRIVEDLQGIVF